MDDLLNINSAKTMARFISVCFLVIHVALCVLFWKTGVTPMAIFNVGSVIFYVLSLALINKGYLALWTDLVYLEVVAHMVCAALLCGWDSDFQTAILAVSSLTFFSEYVCRCLNINYAHGLPLCIFGAVAYLVTCAVCALRPAPYALPDSASLLLKLVWGIIVFSVLIVGPQGLRGRGDQVPQGPHRPYEPRQAHRSAQPILRGGVSGQTLQE